MDTTDNDGSTTRTPIEPAPNLATAFVTTNRTEDPALFDIPGTQRHLTSVHVLARYFVVLGFADEPDRIIDLEALLALEEFQDLRTSYEAFRAVEVSSTGDALRWPTGVQVPADLLHRASKPNRP